VSPSPLVSVIMPTYNNGRHIEAALDSASRQTYERLEVIVVNDGSTDSTLEIASRAALNDPRICVSTQPNSGVPSIARNAGIRMARGEYVCFLDGDDVFYPDKVRRCVDAFEASPSLQFLFHDMRYMSEAGQEEPESHLRRRASVRPHLVAELPLSPGVFPCDSNLLAYWSCLRSLPFQMPAVMVQRTLLDAQAVWFPEDLLIGEDFDLWLRLVKSGSVGYLDEILSARRMHEHSITRRPDNPLWVLTARTRAYDYTAGFFSSSQRKAFRERISADLFDCGYAESLEGNVGKARSFYIAALRWDKGVRAIVRSLLGILKAHLKHRFRRTIRATGQVDAG